jgi:antirestriction protein
MDHENYGGLLDGECSPSEAQKMAETIEHIESCGIPVEAVAAYRDHVGPGYFDPSVNSLDDFSDAYQGEWKDEEDFAYELAKDIGFTEPDTWPGSYIDWERATRDLFLGDYWSAEAPGGIYVFRS